MKALTFAAALMLSCAAAPLALAASETNALREARSILTAESMEMERPAYRPGHGVNFNSSDHVFPEERASDRFRLSQCKRDTAVVPGPTRRKGKMSFTSSRTRPILRSRTAWASITAPKLAEAIGSLGVQNVTLEDGIMKFAGNVDFSPEYKAVPGDPPGYRPKSPIPAPSPTTNGRPSCAASGIVLNAQIVANASGHHLRVKAIDTDGPHGDVVDLRRRAGRQPILLSSCHRRIGPDCGGAGERRCPRATARGNNSLVRRISAGERSRPCSASRRAPATAARRGAPARIRASRLRSPTAELIRSTCFRSARTTTIPRVRTTIAPYGTRMSACGRRPPLTPARCIASTRWMSKSL